MLKNRSHYFAPGPRQEAVRKYQAAIPPFDGRHLWVFVGMWRVFEPARDTQNLDMENMLTVDGPGCFWCELTWSPTIGAHCPGAGS